MKNTMFPVISILFLFFALVSSSLNHEPKMARILLAHHPIGLNNSAEPLALNFMDMFRNRPIVIHATFEKKIIEGQAPEKKPYKKKKTTKRDGLSVGYLVCFFIFTLLLASGAGVAGFFIGKRAESRNYMPVPSDN